MPAAIEWTNDILEELETRIIAGTPILYILRDLNISENSFYRHRLKDAEFDSRIARAQEFGQDANIDRTETLAATATPENWQLVQFQCRNAQWIASKRKARKYGDKIEHDVNITEKRVVSDI